MDDGRDQGGQKLGENVQHEHVVLYSEVEKESRRVQGSEEGVLQGLN